MEEVTVIDLSDDDTTTCEQAKKNAESFYEEAPLKQASSDKGETVNLSKEKPTPGKLFRNAKNTRVGTETTVKTKENDRFVKEPTKPKTIKGRNMIDKFAIAWDAPQILDMSSAVQINVNVNVTDKQTGRRSPENTSSGYSSCIAVSGHTSSGYSSCVALPRHTSSRYSSCVALPRHTSSGYSSSVALPRHTSSRYSSCVAVPRHATGGYSSCVALPVPKYRQITQRTPYYTPSAHEQRAKELSVTHPVCLIPDEKNTYEQINVASSHEYQRVSAEPSSVSAVQGETYYEFSKRLKQGRGRPRGSTKSKQQSKKEQRHSDDSDGDVMNEVAARKLPRRRAWLSSGAYRESDSDNEQTDNISRSNKKRRNRTDADYFIPEGESPRRRQYEKRPTCYNRQEITEPYHGYSVSGINVMVTPILTKIPTNTNISVKQEPSESGHHNPSPKTRPKRKVYETINLDSDSSDHSPKSSFEPGTEGNSDNQDKDLSVMDSNCDSTVAMAADYDATGGNVAMNTIEYNPVGDTNATVLSEDYYDDIPQPVIIMPQIPEHFLPTKTLNPHLEATEHGDIAQSTNIIEPAADDVTTSAVEMDKSVNIGEMSKISTNQTAFISISANEAEIPGTSIPTDNIGISVDHTEITGTSVEVNELTDLAAKHNELSALSADNTELTDMPVVNAGLTDLSTDQAELTGITAADESEVVPVLSVDKGTVSTSNTARDNDEPGENKTEISSESEEKSGASCSPENYLNQVLEELFPPDHELRSAVMPTAATPKL